MRLHRGTCLRQVVLEGRAANAEISAEELLDQMEVILDQLRLKCDIDRRTRGDDSGDSGVAVVDLVLTAVSPVTRQNWVKWVEDHALL